VFSGYYDAQIMIGAFVVAKGSTGLFRSNTNLDGVDRVFAELGSKSFDEIVFQKSQLRCPCRIGDRNNKRCSLHCNRSALCGDCVTNEFRPPAKNASRDICRRSTEVTHNAVEACMHRNRITG
jgi:hypothetical protein